MSAVSNFSIAAGDGALTRQADGTYLVVWASGADIKAQVFNADGVEQGGELSINTRGANVSDISAAVLKDGTGRSILSWMEAGTIKKLILKADHTPESDAQTVDWTGLISESAPKVHAMDDGGYSIVYKGLEKGLNGNSDQPWYGLHTVHGGQVTAQNKAISPDDAEHATTVLTNAKSVLIYANFIGNLQVESDLNFTGIDRFAGAATEVCHSVAALAGGKFIVTWQDDLSATDTTEVIRAQLFDATHTAEGGLITFTKPAGTILNTAVTQLADGRLVLALTMDEGGDRNVYVMTRSAGGTVTDPIFVGQSKTGSQTDPSIIGLDGDKFVVGWTHQAEGEAPKFMTEVFGTAVNPTNVAPTIAVDPTKVLTAAVDTGSLVNPFGGLSFADAEENVLTVTISFDASHGKLVVPVGLQAPGFEERNGKKIYTFTGKADALAIIMDVLQFDAVERPLAQVGSHHVTTFTIGVTDADHATPAETFVKVDTTVTNRAPTDIGLSGFSVAELTGGEVGILSAADQFGAEFTYELIDTAGGRFSLVSGADATGKTVTKVMSANGLLLDHEQARSHSIGVKVTDKEGASFIKTFTINVGDVSAENIFGSAGNDVFVGGAGRDTIRGSSGNDVLTGGAGKDIFVFDTKPHAKSNKDLIKDWNYRDDTIQLENAVFKALKKTGTLKKDFFTLGSKAKDANDHVGYNKANGDLWWDSNGNKAGGQVVLANIGTNKAIFHADFAVI